MYPIVYLLKGDYRLPASYLVLIPSELRQGIGLWLNSKIPKPYTPQRISPIKGARRVLEWTFI